MFNPLVDDFSVLSDSEVEEKISELSRKYFQSRNLQVQEQISVILEMFKDEARSRRAKSMLKNQQENGEEGLDNLIKVS
jgi:hypothetical protein